MKRALLVIALVIIADQWLKIWVKLTMMYNESISIMGDKGFLHFIENPGMAFGLEFGGEVGKLLLSLFRVAVLIGLGFYLRSQIKAKAHSDDELDGYIESGYDLLLNRNVNNYPNLMANNRNGIALRNIPS